MAEFALLRPLLNPHVNAHGKLYLNREWTLQLVKVFKIDRPFWKTKIGYLAKRSDLTWTQKAQNDKSYLKWNFWNFLF